MNPLDPRLMTTKERLTQVCALLARGLCRLRLRNAQLSAADGKTGLHFNPDQSGGANPPIRRTA